MKALKFLAVAASLVVVAACGQKGGNAAEGADSLAVKPVTPKKASALLPSKAQKDSVSYLIGYIFGGYIKNYNFGDDLNFGKIKEGINDLLKAKAVPGSAEFEKEFKISPKEVDRLFTDYLSKRYEYTKVKNLEEGQKYLAKMLKRGFSLSDNGLAYRIGNPGADRKAQLSDTLEVTYRGTFINGDVFDETNPERGNTTVILGTGGVIPGWEEGLQLVGEGGSISLIVPAELAYGEQGTRGMEPNKTLLFDIDVVSVKPYVAPAENNDEE